MKCRAFGIRSGIFVWDNCRTAVLVVQAHAELSELLFAGVIWLSTQTHLPSRFTKTSDVHSSASNCCPPKCAVFTTRTDTTAVSPYIFTRGSPAISNMLCDRAPERTYSR